jgi:hypothetical protein
MLSTLRRAPPDGSRFTSVCYSLPMHKSCTRVFATHHELVRLKIHRSQKRTPCADMEKAVKVYSVDDNRASSLQPSRIVECPLSGTMIYLRMILIIRTIRLQTHVRKFSVNRAKIGFFMLVLQFLLRMFGEFTHKNFKYAYFEAFFAV